MKKHFYTIGSIIVLLFSALIFIVLPAMVGGAKAEKLPPFGSYDGKPIVYEQGSPFANTVSNYAELLKWQGQEVTDSTYFYIFNQAFNSTVVRMAYDSAVAKSGWKVPANAVNRELVKNFYDENGNYSSRLYKQTSDEVKRDLTKQYEDALTTSRYLEDNFGSNENFDGQRIGADFANFTMYGLKASSKEIPFICEMGKKRRSFDTAVFSTDNYPEEKILSYANEHKDLFVKYDLSVITVNDESTAKTVLDRLNKNEIVFADAVTEYSTKNYTNDSGKINNNLNYQVKNIISDADAFNKVCALKSGETSGIVKTSTGYSIFKADSDATPMDFSETANKNTVKSYLNTYERGLIEDYYVALAKDFSAQALKTDFNAACKKFNIDNQSIEDFALNYGNLSIIGTSSIESSSPLAAITSDENAIKTAFALKQNEISESLVLGRNIIVLKMKGETNGGTDLETANQTFQKEIDEFDEQAAQTALFNSPKVKNNVMEVYFNNFMAKN